MLNQTGIKVTSYENVNQILEDNEVFTAVSCIVSSTGVTAGSDGRKIAKAGTPLAGSLKNRSVPFKIITDGGTATGTQMPVGLLENDIDLTAGDANGSILTFATVNLSRMDEDTRKIAEKAENNLKHIIMVV